jgi:hypothetical protein
MHPSAESRELRKQAAFDRQANNYLPADARYAPHSELDVEDKFSINVLVERLAMEFGVDKSRVKEIVCGWWKEF